MSAMHQKTNSRNCYIPFHISNQRGSEQGSDNGSDVGSGPFFTNQPSFMNPPKDAVEVATKASSDRENGIEESKLSKVRSSENHVEDHHLMCNGDHHLMCNGFPMVSGKEGSHSLLLAAGIL